MNYKFISLYIAVFGFLFFSCKSDEEAIPEPTPPFRFENGAHLTIDEIKKEFPGDLYQSSSLLIFKNEAGDERRLAPNYSEHMFERTAHGISYTFDQVNYLLFEEADPSYYFDIVMSANLTSNSSSIEGLSILLNGKTPGILNPWLILTTDDLNGDYDYGLIEEQVLLGKTFKDVLKVWTIPPDQTAYSDLFFNSEFGVIGFSDKDDVLWVYDRAEE